jgi:hypothetical protein
MSRQNDNEFNARALELLATVGPNLRDLLEYIEDDLGLERYLSKVEQSVAKLDVEKIYALFTTSFPPSSVEVEVADQLFLIRREAEETARMHNHPERYSYLGDRPTYYEIRSRSVLLILWNCLPVQERRQLFQLFNSVSGFSFYRDCLSEILASQHVIINKSLELVPMVHEENLSRCS